ncbi:T9SS type A sorting domain-containing protein [Hymenobacter sp. M29]|uniref:T9SS type A sorting domain-containing protein n=1 Tax=Hymenobacter mellowenesis TaxID=3063995 RepID=A0ABT9AG23_9BACT|nr:T9SS type A sorting domain-containing protein [Hymenobacter sp. M29]MDO7848312.1 T9SS type A sorting domain-containing protein [Hymenobacter sp. M29]
MKNSLLITGLLAGSLALAGQASAQTTPIYKFWSLKVNATDSAALRSPSTMPASNAILRKLVLSSGLPVVTTATPPVTIITPPPFSSQYGMAFAPAADGGGWSSNATPPGPGSVLRRTFGVQFTATAPAGVTLRADSLVMNLTFLNTTSGTNIAIVYSKNNFGTPADSTESSGGGKGPNGALVPVANGSTFFNTYPITNSLSAISATGSNPPNNFRYSVALNGANGVTIAPGQTLTLRMYVSCSSGSQGRHALLRNVALKSLQAPLAVRPALQTNLAVYPNPTQNQLNVPHTAASRDAHVTLFGTTGAKVAAFAVQAGSTETAVDLGALPKGLYLIEYADGVQRSSARIVKE